MKLRSILTRLLFTMVGMVFVASAMAQSLTVSGIVRDGDDNSVLAGVAVMIEGTSRGTVTDFDGNFSLTAEAGDNLVFSYLGYATQTVAAAANMNVVLESDMNDLDDVVVIGYGVAKKNDLTGSVTAIKPDEKNRGLVTNAQDMMQGKIAGVNVTTSSGAPGTGATIRIRGGSSLNASNDPLIVIDGLAMDNQGVKGLSNPLSMVNPSDIETFTVLKDASATAIYGSRGSNGVIIITTKKGRAAQKPRLSYNGNVSVSVKQRDLDVMNADEYRSFITSYYGEDSEAASLLGDADTDWQDEIYRAAISHDHNLTLTGGTKSMLYRVSLGYTGQDGILKTSDFKRYTVGANLNPTFFKEHLKLNVNLKGMIAKTRYANTSAIGAATRFDPTQSVTSSDDKYKNFGGYFQWVKANSDISDANWDYISERNAVMNPVAALETYDDRATSKSLVGNLEIDYKIHGFEDLRLHADLGANLATGKQTTTEDPSCAGDNNYYGWSAVDIEDKYTLSLDAYAQYYKDFNANNHFDVMLGYEWQHLHYQGTYNGYGLYPSTYTGVDDSGNALSGTEINTSDSKWASESFLVSFFGRANYTLMDRYMLTATVRYDGSSRFADHWSLFPSFAFGWRIKQESFLRDVNAVSDLKLRLGYGATGQQEGIGDYTYLASYDVSTASDAKYDVSGNGGEMYLPNAYNKDIKWETTKTYNVGLDFGFIGDFLTGSVDYYYRKTVDLLNTVTVPAGSNFRNQVTSNIGSLRNTGVELALTVRPISSPTWNLEITGNATYNSNEITELTGEDGYYVQTGGISSGTGNYCQAHSVGHAASSFYVYQQVYDKDGNALEGVYVDRNGDGVINNSDLYFFHSPAAPWTYGLSARLSYKKFDLALSLRANVGNYVFNDVACGMANVAKTYDNSYAYLQNRVKSAIDMNWASYDNCLSDYWVQNASFLKCDNITLGYNFDKLFAGSSYKGINGRVYLTASNVFTITNYEGIDPEVSGGIDNNIYPRPFSMILGLNLNF